METPKESVFKYIDEYNAKNLDAVIAHLDPDCKVSL